MDDIKIKDEDMPEIKRIALDIYGWNFGNREPADLDKYMEGIISILGNEADSSVAYAVGQVYNIEELDSCVVDCDGRLKDLTDSLLLRCLIDMVLDQFSSRQWAVKTAIEILAEGLMGETK